MGTPIQSPGAGNGMCSVILEHMLHGVEWMLQPSPVVLLGLH